VLAWRSARRIGATSKRDRMRVRTIPALLSLALAILLACAALLAACTRTPARAQDDSGVVVRRGFLGAFFRPQGPPPFGVFSPQSPNRAPDPYPKPNGTLFGPAGYCDAVAANGVSISTGYPVDRAKLANIVDLGVKWTRSTAAPQNDDRSHILSTVKFAFGDLDSAQCALARSGIDPVIELQTGPVEYDAVPGRFSPQEEPHYKSAGDFAAWCSAVATHERAAFPNVRRYSVPGNELNTDPASFPGGEAGIAAYASGCYRAVKRADPHATVYGFELNMDRHADPTGFIRRMRALGCGVGTCYDALSIHLSLRYPIPPASKPCFPNPFGDYDLQCVADVRAAAGSPVHILIGETAYFVPATVPDEETKARAVVAAFTAFSRLSYVDGVNYANVDECGLYPTGYFSGGCLVDTAGRRLPAYHALSALARRAF
jgi:hypothetical protein